MVVFSVVVVGVVADSVVVLSVVVDSVVGLVDDVVVGVLVVDSAETEVNDTIRKAGKKLYRLTLWAYLQARCQCYKIRCKNVT